MELSHKGLKSLFRTNLLHFKLKLSIDFLLDFSTDALNYESVPARSVLQIGKGFTILSQSEAKERFSLGPNNLQQTISINHRFGFLSPVIAIIDSSCHYCTPLIKVLYRTTVLTTWRPSFDQHADTSY